MARGWESKSVEQQQEALTAVSKGPVKARSPQQIAILQRRESLELARRSVLSQIESASSPRHRELLEKGLAELDRQLAELG